MAWPRKDDDFLNTSQTGGEFQFHDCNKTPGLADPVIRVVPNWVNPVASKVLYMNWYMIIYIICTSMVFWLERASFACQEMVLIYIYI